MYEHRRYNLKDFENQRSTIIDYDGNLSMPYQNIIFEISFSYRLQCFWKWHNNDHVVIGICDYKKLYYLSLSTCCNSYTKAALTPDLLSWKRQDDILSRQQDSRFIKIKSLRAHHFIRHSPIFIACVGFTRLQHCGLV